MKDLIFLYGPPGVGKSTVGKLLAEALGIEFVDLDKVIVWQADKSISEIFAEDGEVYFRALEQAALESVVDLQPAVVALGGGALVNEENRAFAEAHGVVVYLDGSVDVLVERLKRSSESRPLIASDLEHKLKELLSSRAEHYTSFPVRFDTDGVEKEEVVWEVQKRLGWFHITGMGNSYDARVLAGGLESIGQIYTALERTGSVMVVTDDNVASHYARKLLDVFEKQGVNVHLHTVPAGEANKNMQTISGMWDAFLAARLDRKSIVLALGGGVVGDMAGFAASTYMRGIDWINVPTSLLSMVDAGVGGKTGVDLPQGKNLVGAFHPPRFVLVDPEVLATLPQEELRCGMAEVVKHGVIAAPRLFAQCEAGLPQTIEGWSSLVREALAVKVNMIKQDPYEKGVRAVLNLGHTIGHAVELLSDFAIPHGEAVAIGLVAEARLAEQIGLAQQGLTARVSAVLAEIGLPTEIPAQMDQAEILRTMQLDKKAANGKIRFSLPEDVGNVQYGIVVENLAEVMI